MHYYVFRSWKITFITKTKLWMCTATSCLNVRHLALFENVFVYGIMPRSFCSFRILTASIDNRNAWNLPLFLKNETTKNAMKNRVYFGCVLLLNKHILVLQCLILSKNHIFCQTHASTFCRRIKLWWAEHFIIS